MKFKKNDDNSYVVDFADKKHPVIGKVYISLRNKSVLGEERVGMTMWVTPGDGPIILGRPTLKACGLKSMDAQWDDLVNSTRRDRAWADTPEDDLKPTKLSRQTSRDAGG